MMDIQDLLDELEDAAYYRQDYLISDIRAKIDEWLEQNISEEIEIEIR